MDSGPQDVAPDTGPPLVTISGTGAPHPLTALLEAPTPTAFTMINVAVVDPSIVLANPAAPPLKGGPLDTSTANCPGSSCAWSFDNVNISTISLGLVGILDDARTTGRLWLKTGTGAGAADFINMIKITRAPITNRPLFAVSVATEAKLALFAATVIPDATMAAGGLNTAWLHDRVDRRQAERGRGAGRGRDADHRPIAYHQSSIPTPISWATGLRRGERDRAGGAQGRCDRRRRGDLVDGHPSDRRQRVWPTLTAGSTPGHGVRDPVRG